LDGQGLTAARIEGSALLEILSYADAIDLFTSDGQTVPLVLTHMGSIAFREDDDQLGQRQTTESVLDALIDAYGN
jgi:hypothetical protein